MTSRPSVVVTRRIPVDGGTSPNAAYTPEITIDVRVHFPAGQAMAVVLPLIEAVDDVMRQLEAMA